MDGATDWGTTTRQNTLERAYPSPTERKQKRPPDEATVLNGSRKACICRLAGSSDVAVLGAETLQVLKASNSENDMAAEVIGDVSSV